MTKSFLRAAIATAAVLAPSLAFAHPGGPQAHGFLHGVAHPVSGIDHVLAMVAVGLFAATLGGRALWAVPAAFVSLMLVGGAIGIAGIGLPYAELGIALSVVVIGAAVALGRIGIPVVAAMALVGVFAVFHGHAHGAEMPADASGVGYAAGFAVATALLHAAGIAAGLGFARIARTPLATRFAGAGVVVAGVGLLTGML